jgi:hypothetical protein
VAGSYEHGYEPTFTTKSEEFWTVIFSTNYLLREVTCHCPCVLYVLVCASLRVCQLVKHVSSRFSPKIDMNFVLLKGNDKMLPAAVVPSERYMPSLFLTEEQQAFRESVE